MTTTEAQETIKRGAITAADAAKIAREIRAGVKNSFRSGQNGRQ